MINFEIDGEEYTAKISKEQTADAMAFTTPDGVTYWMQRPESAE